MTKLFLKEKKIDIEGLFIFLYYFLVIIKLFEGQFDILINIKYSLKIKNDWHT